MTKADFTSDKQHQNLRDLEKRLSMLEQAWGSQVPRLLERISDLNNRQLQVDIAQEQMSTDLLRHVFERIEFIRRELMFEFSYGEKVKIAKKISPKVEARIIDGHKLEEAREKELRLNLGCGHILLEGYLNVDCRELPGVDIVTEADRLPFEEEEIQEIFSSHMLEHFPQEELKRKLLPYYFSLLKPGGIFKAVVPDGEAMIREFSVGNFSYDNLREAFYGAQEYDGDFHYNIFTPDSLSKLLIEAGFCEVEIIEKGRLNGNCLEFEIKALRDQEA